jgi:hypothetical protein
MAFMADSLVNEIDNRSIDGRKDGAIPSSGSIDKPAKTRPVRIAAQLRRENGFHSRQRVKAYRQTS